MEKTLNGSVIGVFVLSPVARRCYLDCIQFFCTVQELSNDSCFVRRIQNFNKLKKYSRSSSLLLQVASELNQHLPNSKFENNDYFAKEFINTDRQSKPVFKLVQMTTTKVTSFWQYTELGDQR